MTTNNLHPLAVLGPAQDAQGCLQGYCTTTFDALVALLGEPHIRNGDKTTVEWSFRCHDGTVFTVYDYKRASTPLGKYRWYIGGTDRALEAFGRHTGLAADALHDRLSIPDTARLEVRIDGQLNQQLESIAVQLGPGASKADVVRRALALYLLAKEREAQGAKLQFTGPGAGTSETVINI